ncbi:hypothetical protein ACFLUJ_09270 [Chloroflexota bacterium]
MGAIPCESFKKRPDGVWVCEKTVTLKGPSGDVVIHPGQTFRPERLLNGLNIAELLEKNCK